MIGRQTRGKVWQAIFDGTRPVAHQRKGSVLNYLGVGQRCPNANVETSRTQIVSRINSKATVVDNSLPVVSWKSSFKAQTVLWNGKLIPLRLLHLKPAPVSPQLQRNSLPLECGGVGFRLECCRKPWDFNSDGTPPRCFWAKSNTLHQLGCGHLLNCLILYHSALEERLWIFQSILEIRAFAIRFGYWFSFLETTIYKAAARGNYLFWAVSGCYMFPRKI